MNTIDFKNTFLEVNLVLVIGIFNSIVAMINIKWTSLLGENFVFRKWYETVLLNHSAVTQVRNEACHKCLLSNTVEVLKLANNLHLKIYLEQRQGYLCDNITLIFPHVDMSSRSEVQYL